MLEREVIDIAPQDSGEEFYWYTLLVYRNEDKCFSTIKEHVMLCKLQNKILDMKILKEHVITESSDYPPDSDEFPKRGFKTTEKSAWVKLSSGNYRRIRLTERRPFAGMIFIKMVHDPELFKQIRRWDAGVNFLGGTNAPIPMSDFQMKKTEDSLNKEIPNIQEYIKEKNYLLVEGFASSYKNVFVEAPKTIQQDSKENEESLTLAEEQKQRELEEAKSFESKKAEIYSELNIKQYEDTILPQGNKFKKKSDKDFSVNDYVFIKHLGFKGVIQEINTEAGTVIVGVQMFGRRQPVECKIFEISPI